MYVKVTKVHFFSKHTSVMRALKKLKDMIELN